MSVIRIKLDFQRLEQIGVHFSHGARRSQELAFGASVHRLSTVTGGRVLPFPRCHPWHTDCRLHVCCLQDGPIWLLSRHPCTVRTATERQRGSISHFEALPLQEWSAFLPPSRFPLTSLVRMNATIRKTENENLAL